MSASKPVLMPYIKGYEEDGFVKQLDVTRQSIEILTPDKVIHKNKIKIEDNCIVSYFTLGSSVCLFESKMFK